MKPMYQVVLNEMNREKDFPVIKTGFPDIDNVTGYLREGSVSLMGARPAMGKHTLSAQLVGNMASDGYFVAWFSVVRSSYEIAQRIADTNPNFCYPQNIFLEDRIWNVKEILSTLVQMEPRPDIAVIDTLQDLYCISRKGHILYDPAFICASLKAFARRHHMAFLLLSKLTQAPDYRRWHTPIPTDIPRWDKIKNSVDIVGLLYRDGYYEESQTKVQGANLFLRPSMESCASVSFLWDSENVRFLPFG